MKIDINYVQVFLLALGLSMDAMAVSAVNGFVERKMKYWKVIFMAFLYGFFQFFMPLIGYGAGSLIVDFFSNVIPYIALILLGFLGGKMIYDGVKGEDEIESGTSYVKYKTLFVQAIATSIDALSIGLLFVEDTVVETFIESGIIGVTTFIISWAAYYVGRKFGTYLNDKAQIVGGIILIGIGLKIFISYIIDKY